MSEHNRELIQRVGKKIALIRECMISQGNGQEFVAFRFAGREDVPLEDYHQSGWPPGGIYAQEESKREQFVDEKMTAMGLT